MPEVQEFEGASTTVDEVVDALKLAGGVIIRRFIGMQEIEAILNDVKPYLDADKPWDGKKSKSMKFVKD